MQLERFETNPFKLMLIADPILMFVVWLMVVLIMMVSSKTGDNVAFVGVPMLDV